mmetsp:Transcript_8371/g.15636  ORF Transcript_8371/g.15636 Transcript_8371/m.15636 type:complete len:203 (+) Transcript_8371:8163-8771(+)
MPRLFNFGLAPTVSEEKFSVCANCLNVNVMKSGTSSLHADWLFINVSPTTRNLSTNNRNTFFPFAAHKCTSAPLKVILSVSRMYLALFSRALSSSINAKAVTFPKSASEPSEEDSSLFTLSSVSMLPQRELAKRYSLCFLLFSNTGGETSSKTRSGMKNAQVDIYNVDSLFLPELLGRNTKAGLVPLSRAARIRWRLVVRDG